jgi:ATP-dependent Clp protease protease subunit
MSNVKFEAKGNRGEIWLYDSIGESYFGGISAKSFQKDLAGLGRVSTINLRINSPGGDVFDGLAIYNLLKAHPAQIVVDVDGLAASIASVIAMAGSSGSIRMAANAMLMIHDPHGVAVGSSSEMQRVATLLDQVKVNLADTYAKRTGQPRATIDGWMSDETWFTSDAAMQAGFADSIAAEQKVAAHFDLSAYRNVPQQLKRRIAAQTVTRSPANDIARVRLAEQDRRLAHLVAG